MNKEIYDILKPTISITYYTKNNIINKGDFNYIPKDTYAARIYQKFPIVTANEDISFLYHIYNLYIGKKVSIDEYLKQITTKQQIDNLLELKKNYQNIVIPIFQNKYYPVDNNDHIYPSFESFSKSIKTIGKIYFYSNEDIHQKTYR